VGGVDVWLNTPEHPLEASGTSGEKAGMNGAINLSVLDGWWDEGYNGENGWAITPHGTQYDADARNRAEANELLDILEYQVIPLYYERNGHGFSEGWVGKSKASMKSILPRFNSQRMVTDYVKSYYGPAARHAELLGVENGAAARELARWKEKISTAWPKVQIRRVDHPQNFVGSNDTLPIEVAVQLNGLDIDDVNVECLTGTESEHGEFITHSSHKLAGKTKNEKGETIFTIDLKPTLPGLQYYKLRIFPYHRLLAHEFETGCMLWV
jgi:starch phosphorylase